MSEMTGVKVYELAKELGIDSISLVDKLRSLEISVKNHMSDLTPADVEAAKAALAPKEPEGKKKKAASKTGVKTRKAAGTSTATKAASAAPTSSAKSTSASTAKKVVRSRKAAEPATEETGDSKTVASPIIRRRVKADGETEVVSSAPVGAAARAAKRAQEEVEATDESVESYTETQESVETTDENLQAASQREAATEPAAPEEPAVDPTVNTPISRPSAPERKSFLKIVAAPVIKPTSRPIPGSAGVAVIKAAGTTGTTQDQDGFRIIRMNKASLDQMAEEEAAKKRAQDRRGDFVKPEDVRFRDYRKKEMVFLPKKKRLPVGKEIKRTEITTPRAEKRVVEMGETITVSQFADQLKVKASDVMRKLMNMGQMVTLHHPLDFDTATLLAAEYQYEVRNIAFNEEAILADATEDNADSLISRPPVVTIMGHVDHGKTSLLDAIREANVAGGEAGGITQHIGAYTVSKNGKLITFIDTPGHEAFTQMRARGANSTDIVILVVAADDGVMPQTREALSHAKAAKVPIIVAVNKIDKPGANPEKIKQGLSELDLLPEDWGGETMFVPVSALKKTNLDKLLDAILLQAEVLDLKANPAPRASGVVLEARLERGRGPVASILVQRGTLRQGDYMVAGTVVGRVRALTDDKGKQVKEATPGFAVEVQGLESIPSASDAFNIVEGEADGRRVVQHRMDQIRAAAAASSGKMTLEDLFAKVQTGDVKELPVIVKADVFGSVEAVRDSLIKASTEKVKVKVIHSATGGVTESDVLLASASNAIIIGFNVRPETKARQVAEAEHVEIKSYNIIYELLDDIKKAMAGLLDKKKVEKFLGRAEVRQVFTVPKSGVVAGSAVIDGKIIRGANVRLLRDSRVIYEGKMSSLRRFKDDAKEVAQGYECGIGIENYNDLKPGDLIEAYEIELISQEL